MNLRKTDGVDNRAPTARRPARTRLTSALGGGYNSPWKQERVRNGSGTGSRLRCLTASIRAPQRRGPALTSLSAWPSAPEKSVPGPVRPLVLGTLLAVAAALGACGRVAPQFEPANLTVTSTPAGAAILLDGIDTGQVTPYRFTGLEATTHEVRLILDEWFSDPEFIPVDLRPLDDVEIDFALLQTGVRVTSEPAGARIVVDGIDTGRVTPATVGGLQPGPVQISLALDTWLCVPESREVTVVEGEVVEVPAADLRLRSRRTVLLESFGNVSCATCADAAENLVTLTATPGYGAERAVYLEFSVSWPNPIDPFYQANPGENADRYTYYYVLGAPALYVNGSALADPLNLGQSTAAVAAQWADDPGFLIDVATRPGVGGALTVTATLTPATDLDLTGCILYLALYENLVTYASPPGNNGQMVFHHMFRDRVDTPPALATLSAGTPVGFERTLNLGTVSPANATIVAFVQRVADKAVLQAGSIAVMPEAAKALHSRSEERP